MSEWISVKDRLPDKGGRYIVHDLTLGVQGYYYHPDVYCPAWKTVTHWMPLPEPPKEDNDGI